MVIKKHIGLALWVMKVKNSGPTFVFILILLKFQFAWNKILDIGMLFHLSETLFLSCPCVSNTESILKPLAWKFSNDTQKKQKGMKMAEPFMIG